jgi:hypothetical protein
MRTFERAAISAAVLVLAAFTSASQAQVAKPYFEFKLPKMDVIPGDLSLDTNGQSPTLFNPAPGYVLGFEGVSQYDGASFGRNFIPPDTMGAVGMSQYMQTTNGAYAIFDKATGTRLSLVSDVAFWAAAGQTGANGDSRVMYNADAKRWLVVSFGANAKDLQLAVSDTDNALGTWKSVKFEGYAGFGFGATADYPTLALDKNAVYIGTNNFAPATSGGSNSFRGTTMNVIPLNSLFNGAAPTIANMTQIVTPYSSSSASNVDMGFAQQGVNSRSASSSGRVVGASLFNYDNLSFQVNGLTPDSAAGATATSATYFGMDSFVTAGAGRQPSAAIPANQRVIATLDERISSSVYESNGRIYTVNTVDSAADGVDEARVRLTVVDAATNALLDQLDLGSTGFDYYQGAIAVNEFGQVVVGYNRSGLSTADLNGDGLADGNISFLAQVLSTEADGSLSLMGSETLLKVSLTDDYHNGSIFGQAASGRQRWGDYAQVSIDPADPHSFWVIGEFAREYNLEQFGHPGGTGGSRWGTWIAQISAVPEPSTWGLMALGVGVLLQRTRRRAVAA